MPDLGLFGTLEWPTDWGIALALVLATAIIYWPISTAQFLNLDDPLYVSANPHVLGGLSWSDLRWDLTTQQGGYWIPATWLSLMLDATLFGPGPFGFHLTNVVLHATNAVILFVVLLRLTHSRLRSAFVAAVFCVHPLHVESVAWVTERKDVLSTLFWWSSLGLYGLYVQTARSRDLVLSLIAFVIGLTAKPALVTLPLTLLLLDLWPLGRMRLSGPDSNVVRLIREKQWFFGFSAAAALVTLWTQRHAEAGLQALSFAGRSLNAVLSLRDYVLRAFWPSNLAIFYPFPATIPIRDVAVAAVCLFAFSAFALAIVRRAPYITVGWFWFLVTLAPVSGLMQSGAQGRADRFMYVPLVGLTVIVAWSIPALVARVRWANADSCSPISRPCSRLHVHRAHTGRLLAGQRRGVAAKSQRHT